MHRLALRRVGAFFFWSSEFLSQSALVGDDDNFS